MKTRGWKTGRQAEYVTQQANYAIRAGHQGLYLYYTRTAHIGRTLKEDVWIIPAILFDKQCNLFLPALLRIAG